MPGYTFSFNPPKPDPVLLPGVMGLWDVVANGGKSHIWLVLGECCSPHPRSSGAVMGCVREKAVSLESSPLSAAQHRNARAIKLPSSPQLGEGQARSGQDP